eukprot:TRINITY_DN9920_c0_g1_i1.p1 TRINITY_DN9920_c0_g1~~TRINITY_DN9920_c0_g1_i1.p1  ORF type:complete len:332 (+),score=31.90 TRINITY_DN9920_c0_g1_i1:130-996(+)
MAVQVHVAFSSVFKGVGVVAGGPFYCARGKLSRATESCMSIAFQTDIPDLVSETKSFAANGQIDDISNLADAPVWLFSGTMDFTVTQAVVKDVATYYTSFLKSADQIQTQFTTPATHTQPTNDYGNACSYFGKPFIDNCNLDGAGLILQHMYGSLHPATTPSSPSLTSFDQTPYGTSDQGIASQGYIYTPQQCANNSTKCGLHVAFHGCEQNYDSIGDAYVAHAGYNKWAEANNIVILYPQATSCCGQNPNGCWDWWGYTDQSYAFKTGVQMKAIINMVQDLVGAQLY